ncbi:BRCA2-interacting transcriptional repressor EMSY [Bactrocera tryoni]|uniref:BRCA2-interacting transcriptional repressor EMSY n=1 Tax=Bactrocera tryoni TaxID=59916 RepID=UPI001A965B1E|nr:BRCA2-interacting transcriptional repressor EMSY [Bactrocera tryoni]
MWPQALQMSRDECRGILRRLELESYSHVISVFRAQGGLSDNKAKLLEELRGIFHISQERHRAEARRVANDEQLCTIAEAISGPNTWQEWSREGRRSYPMLPRVAPQTALALIANNVATETVSENAKLPYPADTAAAVVAERANTINSITGKEELESWEIKREVYVVTDDPFKMPDIPAANKKNLKRNISDSQTGSNKKRIISDTSPSKQQHQKQFHHITANSGQATLPSTGNSNIRKLYHNHNSKAAQQRLNQTPLQKQKLATKKSQMAAGLNPVLPVTPGKRQATPAKSGRKANSKLQEQKQQQLLAQQQQQQQMLAQTTVRNIQHVVGEGLDEFNIDQNSTQPQIAASKKDITKNLTKLQLPSVITTPPSSGASSVSPNVIAPAIPSNTPLMVNALSTRIDTHQLPTALSPTIGSVGGSSVPTIIHSKVEKMISTPVQKIILEDRLPPQQLPGSVVTTATTAMASAVVVSTASTFQLQSASTPQIMTLPQLSAAATKLRAVNTTILPPGTKITTKKLSGSTLISALGTENNAALTGTANSSGSQVFSIIEGSNSSSNAQATPSLPTHTPPAIIQIQNTNNTSVSTEGTTLQSSQQPAQGKVLTTKLLPIVLSGAGVGGASVGASTAGSGGNTVNITKIETINNGATLVGGGAGGSALSGNNLNTSLGGTTAVLKTMGSTLLLSPNQSGTPAGSTLFSTLTSGAPVFRKSQIIKTGTIGVNASSAGKLSGTFSTSNSGPQIISNIKLTPANTTTSVTAVSHSNQQSQQQSTSASPFLQHQLKNISTTGIRTSVKICQSPNGKVFIQPANIDNASKAKLQGALSHKILPNAVVSSNATGAGTTGTHQPQRIAIQKVQIIPAPLNSPGNLAGTFHTITSQSQSQTKPTITTNTLTMGGNKGNMNMVFVPSVGARTTSGTITLSKPASVSSGIVAAAKVQNTQNKEAVKPNVVIIGSSSTQSSTNIPIKTTTFIDGSNKYNVTSRAANAVQLEANQMITEDTPVDILNMPIIVDSGDGTNITMGNNIGDTVTVLPTTLVESTQQQQQQREQQSQQQQQQPSTIILGATDWEMELDQATAVAAATKAAARTEYRRQSSGQAGGKQQQQQMQDKETIDGETIIIDDSFEDVIVEEQEEGDTDAGTETEGTVDGEMDENEMTDDTGGEEGQEMTERAYTIYSGTESGGEISPAKTRDAPKLKVGRLQKTYNNASANVNDEDEPIEVIDDDEENTTVAVSQKKSAQKAESETAKLERAANAVSMNNARANSISAAVECETDAGFDETIVADIDENTAIEYIEEDNNTLVNNDKAEVNNLNVTAAKSTQSRQIAESEIIVLDDNDSATLTATATATLTAASSSAHSIANEDKVVVECNPKKMVSGNTATTINVAALKPTTVTIVNRND